MPATLGLIYVALPLWNRRWLFPAAVVLVLVAIGCSQAGWGLPGNFAKLGAATFAGWAFLRLFEELVLGRDRRARSSRSSTRSRSGAARRTRSRRTTSQVYTSVAIAFLVPGGIRRVPRAAGRPLLRALPRRRAALEPARRLDVARDGTVVYCADDRDRVRRPTSTACRRCRSSRSASSSRTPTCSGAAYGASSRRWRVARWETELREPESAVSGSLRAVLAGRMVSAGGCGCRGARRPAACAHRSFASS